MAAKEKRDPETIAKEMLTFFQQEQFRQKSLKEIEAFFEDQKRFFNDPAYLASLKYGRVSNSQPTSISKTPKFPPFDWKLPTKASREKRVKIWTCRWEGMDLKIEWVKDREVIFVGYLNGTPICEEKLKNSATKILETEAIKRRKLRD